MSDDLKRFWNQLDGLPRKEVVFMAEEEMKDVRGLSKVKEILYKYNLSSVTIDYKLMFSFQRKLARTPRKELEKEQGKDFS